MKQLNKYFLVVITLLSFAACSLPKEKPVPAVILPASFGSNSIQDTSSAAELNMRDFFKSNALQLLIDSAIRKNFDLQIAVKNIEAANLIFRQVKWEYIPEVVFQAGASTNRYSDNSFNGLSLSKSIGQKHVEDYNAQLGLAWEADIWGKIKNKRAREYNAYLGTVEARNAIQTKIVKEVAQGYYNLLMLDAQLKIAKKNLNLVDSSTTIVKLQYAAGQVTSLAVQQIESQGLVAAKLIPQLEQNAIIQQNALSILVGELPASRNRDVKMDDAQLPTYLSAGIPAQILGRRPDVRGYELAINEARADLGIRKASLYPSLSITAAGGINAFQISNWFTTPASLFGNVMGNLTQPLFQGKRLRTDYEVAKVNLDKSMIQFRQAVLIAVGEVSDALVQIDKLTEQEKIARQRVIVLQRAIGNSSILFKNGMATYLEVITAQSNVLQAELDLAMIKRDELNARVALYTSLGGGWKQDSN